MVKRRKPHDRLKKHRGMSPPKKCREAERLSVQRSAILGAPLSLH
nr:MAG TPA: hypothetical protein [Caudoviricetes sp.]